MNEADVDALSRKVDSLELKGMRKRALELAVDTGRAIGGLSATNVVKAAKEFYSFLKGE